MSPSCLIKQAGSPISPNVDRAKTPELSATAKCGFKSLYDSLLLQSLNLLSKMNFCDGSFESHFGSESPIDCIKKFLCCEAVFIFEWMWHKGLFVGYRMRVDILIN